MAYWYYRFKSLNDTDYEVRIEGATANTEILGAANPIVTEESNEDIFAPIVYQTGYIRIVDMDDTVWRTILPSSVVSRPVRLLKKIENSWFPMWYGYLSAENYGCDYLLKPQQHEFPLVCPLGALAGYDIDPDDGDVESFAGILDYIFSMLDDISWHNVYFLGKQDVTEWLSKKISWMNFCETDEDGNVNGKYNCQEVLEEICKFWGYTCRVAGADIYFCASDESNLSGCSIKTMDFQGLALIAQGAIPTITPVTQPSLSITSEMFATDDNTEKQVRGLKKAKITANVNVQADVLEAPFSKISDIYRNHSVAWDTLSENNYHFTKFLDTANSQHYDLDGITIDTYGSDVYGANRYASFQIDEYYQGEFMYKHNYNFSTSIYMRPGPFVAQAVEYAPVIIFETKMSYSFNHGWFAISADLYRNVIEDGVRKSVIPNGYIYARLRIGNHYWSGEEWEEVPYNWHEIEPFKMRMGKEGSQSGAEGTGNIITTRELEDNCDPYEGYGIPIGDNIGGKVVFEIDAVDFLPNDGTSELNMTAFKMEFVRNTNVNEQKDNSKNTYTAESGEVFTENREVSTIFASDKNNKLGYGLIMNPDNSYCDGVYYEGPVGMMTKERPEQHLVDRMASFGNKSRFLIKAQLRSDVVGEVTPIHVVTEYLGDPTYPLSIRNNWADDELELQLIELSS